MPRSTDFFIAGAPKCGTTALFDYLSSHPGAFIPPCKEPNYFCSDLSIPGVRSRASYQALFAPAPPGALTGDASSMYLYSELAVGQIMAYNPAAKFIVLLRHPVEAARSLYAARRSHGHENAPDFECAWKRQPERLQGMSLPPRWPDPKTLQYGAIYRYAPQLRRLLAHAGRTRCLFVVYEEFFAQPRQQFARVLDFLNLTADPARVAFPARNPTLGTRSLRLQRFLAAPPSWLTALGTPLQKVARAAQLHPWQTLQRLNRYRAEKAALPQSFRQELEDHFAADVAETEALLGRKLWALSPAQPHARSPQRQDAAADSAESLPAPLG